MKLLVIQEQHFVRMPNNEVWVDEQSDSKFWERYLNVFDDVVVCARFHHAESYCTDNLMRSDHEHVSFVELPNTRGVGALMKNYVTIRKIIKNAIKECDRVIFRAPSPMSLVAYPLVKKSGKPFAVEVMNNPATHYSPAAMHNFYQPIIQKLTVNHVKSICANANGVSYVTERVLQELYPCTARLNGESKQFFEASYSTIRMEENRYFFEEWTEDMPDTVTFIHTGKMQDERKGQDIFIKAISILKNSGYDVKGILVGDGVMRKEFEELGKSLGIDDCLDFVGWKAGFESVQEELKRANIAVFPSIGEGLPRSVIEAMAQGLLCFGSKVDGICELLDGDCLVPELTAECFADHIKIYLNDWSLALKERKKQFENSKKYEYTKLEKRRNDFYRKLREID